MLTITVYLMIGMKQDDLRLGSLAAVAIGNFLATKWGGFVHGSRVREFQVDIVSVLPIKSFLCVTLINIHLLMN